MEMKSFAYSLKNIPIPTKRKYLKCMVEKVETSIRRLNGKRITFVKLMHKLKTYSQKFLF